MQKVLAEFTSLGLAVNELEEVGEILHTSDFHRDKAVISSLLDRCGNLDDKLLAWIRTIPKNWSYSSHLLYLAQGPDMKPETWAYWTGNVHQYPNVWVARNWGFYRAYRLTVQALIVRCADAARSARVKPIEELKSAADAAIATMQVLVDEICASVPYQLGDLPDMTRFPDNRLCSQCPPSFIRKGADEYECMRDGLEPGRFTGGLGRTASLPPDQVQKHVITLGGLFALRSLLVAESAPLLPPLQKKWIIGRIFEIARRSALDPKMLEVRLRKNILGFG